MKRPTYRCGNTKYYRLQERLNDNNLTYQEFADWCVNEFLAGDINPKEGKEMKIFKIVELNEKGVSVDDPNKGTVGEIRYFEDNSGLCSGEYYIDDIPGTWVHIEGEHTDFVKYAYRSIDNSTLVPEKVFRDYMINKLAGNYIDADFDWLKENDEELLDWITTSEYWGRGFDRKIEKTEVVARISFHEGGNRVYATFKSHPEQVKQSLNNQPPWGEDSWEDWETEDIAKYYNEFID